MEKSVIFNLHKMEVSLVKKLARYELLPAGNDEKIVVSDLVGKEITLNYLKEIFCTNCNNKIKKSYSGGYCYPCSIRLPECDMCILKPETCHYSKGTCRDPLWGETHCMKPHYVYLANSSGLKVGITRETQIPQRFIDQGAVFALPILKVKTRLQSGIFEKLFSSVLNDKTDWRKMLRGEQEAIDLEKKRDEIFELFGEEIDRADVKFGKGAISVLEKEKVIEIQYPVAAYPNKITSLSLDKAETIKGTLQGIKGQYLIFDTGVINIRNHTGYKIEFKI